jgi:hypothetical protein
MEFLRHPLYSILAVLFIGALCGLIVRPARRASAAVLIGIGAAFVGFHAAMLSNVATGVILFPFAVALVVAALASFALRER